MFFTNHRTQLAAMVFLVAGALMFLAPDNALDARAKKKSRKSKKDTEQVDTVKKETKYDKLFKKQHTVDEGMITLHLLDGKVYFEFPLSLFGREMIMGSTIKSISDNANGVVGAKPSELMHIVFTKVDSTVQMRNVNTDYIANDANIEKALSKSTVGAVLKNFQIKAYNNDSTAVVFDMTDVFLSHDKKMSPFSEYAAYASYTRTENFKKDLSFITGVKSFDDNISVTSSMSYTYTMTNAAGQTLLKDYPLTAELTRSIVLLPEEVYHPRMADYRIGVFFTPRIQLGSTNSSSLPVYFANRWRLEPSDTAAYRRGELVEPVKPIVFYIDNDFPEWWKPYLKEGVEQWQEVFEEIGFKNAIVAKFFPTPEEDPEFDPENIKYSCIRYAPIGIQNAMGPSWVDPRSGEIINAAVYVYHDIVKLITEWRFVQTAQADPDVRAVDLPEEILGDAIRYVLSHEIGHTLGFMHNMSGSSVIPVEKLRDPEFTTETGTTTSIMDYARFNYVAQPGDKERGVKLTPPRFGEYDKWLVKWTYTPVFDVDSFEDEAAITSQWITDSLAASPVYRYGKQQFYSMFFDPRSQTEDLSNDAVAATKYGVANLKYITKNYIDWINPEDDEDYEFRMGIYNAILNQYLMYVQHVMLNVGGLYKNEIKADDTMPRFENIPAAKQKEALNYLFTMAEDLDWLGDKDVVDNLPMIGTPEYAMREIIYQLIMMTPYLASLSDGVVTDEFSFKQCMDVIYGKVWAPTRSGKRLTDAQRQFQRAFVMQLMQSGGFRLPGSETSVAIADDQELVTKSFDAESSLMAGSLMYSPVSGYEWMPRNIFRTFGEAAKSEHYAFLKQTRALIKSRMAGASAKDKAHYEYLVSVIEYGLE